MTHVECKISFIGHDNEVWKVGSVLNQKQRELGHSSASFTILNPHVLGLSPLLTVSKYIEYVY